MALGSVRFWPLRFSSVQFAHNLYYVNLNLLIYPLGAQYFPESVFTQKHFTLAELPLCRPRAQLSPFGIVQAQSPVDSLTAGPIQGTITQPVHTGVRDPMIPFPDQAFPCTRLLLRRSA